MKKGKKIEDTEKLTLGQKLPQVFSLRKMGAQDQLVLNYIKDQRNYFVHQFFIDHDFGTKERILAAQFELEELKGHLQLINRAIKNMLKDKVNKRKRY